MIKNYLLLIRSHQWIKNIFIFLPLFFGLKISNTALLYKTFLAFISFCLIASSSYIFNDFHDIDSDKKHPEKNKRPLASGKISKKSAATLMICLLSAGLGMSYLISYSIFFLLVLYLSLSISYTLKLKHIAIIDVLIIAMGFVLRLFIGSVAGDTKLSMWIIIMTFLLALFLALAKRRDDVLISLADGNKTRKSMDGYNIEFLNSSMMVMASVMLVSYILYTTSIDVRLRVHSDNLYLTVIFVILGILRYMQIVFVEKNSGSPTYIMLKDKFMQLCVLGWFVTFGIIIYR